MNDYLIPLFRWLYELCGLLCHQLDSRCLIIGDGILPVCSRCTGIYLGAWIAFVSRFAGNNWNSILIINRPFWILVFTSLLLMAGDALAGTRLYSYFYPVRTATGFFFGFLIMTLFAEWTKMLLLKKNITRDILIPVQNLILYMFIALLSLFALLFAFSSEKWFFIFMVFFIAFGIIFLYSTVNLVLFFWILNHLRYRCEKQICLIILLIMGFVLFTVQMFVIQISGLSI